MAPLRSPAAAPNGLQSRAACGDDAGAIPSNPASQAQQQEFLQALEHDQGLVQLLTMHRRRYRVPVEEMQLFSDRICQICWSKREVGRGKADPSDVEKLQNELEKSRADHKRQLAICNLNAMKQLDLAHGGTGKVPDDELVSFYEPMQYLSKDHKDLLLMILVDKLRQICDGTAPMSLLEELQRFSFDQKSLKGLSLGQGQELLEESEESQAEDNLRDENEEAWDRVNAAEASLQAAQRQTEEAKHRAELLLDELRTLRAAQDASSARSLKLQQQIQAACRKLLELGLAPTEIEELMGLEPGELANHAGLQAVPALSQFSRREMETEYAAVQAEAVVQTSPLKNADFTEIGDLTVTGSGPKIDGRYPLTGQRTKDGNPIWRRDQPDGNGPKLYNAEGVWAITGANGDVLASSLKMSLQAEATLSLPTDDMPWQDGDGNSVPVKVLKAKAKIEEPSGRQKARKQTAEVAAQTTISGSQVDGWEAENQKLKLALEELQMKVKDLLNRCKQNGIEGVEGIALEMGLKQILKTRACFERLYQDAFRRVDRLEELRRRVRAERAQLLKAVMQDAMGEPSVLSSVVEQSSWPGMQKFLGPELAQQHDDKTRKGRSSRQKPDASHTVLPQIPNSTLRVSSSLPTLNRTTPWRQLPMATGALPQLQARALEPVKPSA